MHLLVHFVIDRHVSTNGFLPDRFDQIINGAQAPMVFLSANLRPSSWLDQTQFEYRPSGRILAAYAGSCRKYRRWESNPHGRSRPEDFKSSASAIPPRRHGQEFLSGSGCRRKCRQVPGRESAAGTGAECCAVRTGEVITMKTANSPSSPLAFRRARRPRSIYGTLWVFATAIEGLVFNPGPIVEEFAFTSQALSHGRTEEPENRES